MSDVPEEDQVDRPVVLHGGDVDDEVDGVDPPVGRVDDDGVVGGVASPHVQQVELNRDHGQDEDELGEGHRHQGYVHFLCHLLDEDLELFLERLFEDGKYEKFTVIKELGIFHKFYFNGILVRYLSHSFQFSVLSSNIFSKH